MCPFAPPGPVSSSTSHTVQVAFVSCAPEERARGGHALLGPLSLHREALIKITLGKERNIIMLLFDSLLSLHN